MARTRRILRLNDVLSEFCMPLRPRAAHPGPMAAYTRYTYYVLSFLFPHRAVTTRNVRASARPFLFLKIPDPFVVFRQYTLTTENAASSVIQVSLS